MGTSHAYRKIPRRASLSLLSRLLLSPRKKKPNPSSFLRRRRGRQILHDLATLQVQDGGDPPPEWRHRACPRPRGAGQAIHINKRWRISGRLCATYKNTDYGYIIFTGSPFCGRGCPIPNRLKNGEKLINKTGKGVNLGMPHGALPILHKIAVFSMPHTLPTLNLWKRNKHSNSFARGYSGWFLHLFCGRSRHHSPREAVQQLFWRGYSLNKPPEFPHNLRFQHSIDTTYFCATFR